MGNYGIQMPEIVAIERGTGSFARFVLQPLERGFGATIGNALRRVLLSSLEGVVITAIRIDGVQHEFSVIPGVTEDVSDIILNLKGVRFKASEFAGGALYHRVKGPGVWRAGDFSAASSEYAVLNPDHYIATLGADVAFGIELRVESGRGYVPSHENRRADDPIGIIAIDAVFTPIKRVSYTVKPTRVKQRVDYERLELEVETDGSLAPEEALAQAAEILNTHINIFTDMQVESETKVLDSAATRELARTRDLLQQSVDDLELSVRAKNCLKAANIRTIGDLVKRDHSAMLKFRNFGRKSLQELERVLEERGLAFGMDIGALEPDTAE